MLPPGRDSAPRDSAPRGSNRQDRGSRDTAKSDAVFARRAERLEWLIFDVDGVLTDGSLLYTRRGEQVKQFNVRDGLGLKLAQRAGLKIALLSGRRSRPLEQRAAELGIDDVMLGAGDKRPIFDQFLARHETVAGRVAFVGDDLPDLPVLGRSALSFAPRDAAPEVLAVVQVVLDAKGGEGAAREVVERVLKARGDWDQLVASYSLED